MLSLKFLSRKGLQVAGTTIVATSLAVNSLVVPATAQEEIDVHREVENAVLDHSSKIKSADEQDAYRFIVHWQKNMATVDDDHKMGIINEILKEFNNEGSKLRLSASGGWIVEFKTPVPQSQVASLRGKLESKAEIVDAYIDMLMMPAAASNDPEYSKQWPFHEHTNHQAGSHANVEEAWDLGYTGSSQNIGIIDSGITKHPDLDPKVKGGFDMISKDFTANDSTPGRDNDPLDTGDGFYEGECPNFGGSADSSWHGTHVAGIAAAATNNGIGVAGTAPEAGLVPVRALGKCGGFASDIADALKWVVGGSVDGVAENPNPVKVVNMSIAGKQRCVPDYQAALDVASAKGATVVVAAGNYNTWTDDYQPANCNSDALIVVGATGPEGYRAEYSNYGDHVTVGAPGGNSGSIEQGEYSGTYVGYREENMFFSTVNSGTIDPASPSYGYQEGTSMASPLVAGVVAMMRDANPSLTSAQIRTILQETAQPYNDEPIVSGSYAPWKTADNMGSGIVDACAAVYEAAVQAGESPAPCGETQSTTPVSTTPASTEPSSTVTGEPTTTVVTTTAPVATSTVKETETAPAITTRVSATTTVIPEPTTVESTVTETSTARTTVKEADETVTLTDVETETQAPVTVTESAVAGTETVTVTNEPVVTSTTSGKPVTLTTTNTVAPEPVLETKTEVIAPSTVLETVKETTTPVTTERETVTSTAADATETQTVATTTTEVVNEEGETHTNVVTTTETSTVKVPTATTIVDSPATTTTTAEYNAREHVRTSSVGGWPLLLLIPLGIAAMLNIPGIASAYNGSANKAFEGGKASSNFKIADFIANSLRPFSGQVSKFFPGSSLIAGFMGKNEDERVSR